MNVVMQAVLDHTLAIARFNGGDRADHTRTQSGNGVTPDEDDEHTKAGHKPLENGIGNGGEHDGRCAETHH